MGIRERGRASVRWLLGDLVDGPRQEGSGKLVVLVACFAALGMWLGVKHMVKGAPLYVSTWRSLVYGGVPLIGVAIWEIRGAQRGIGRSLAGLGALGLSALMAARFTTAGNAAFAALPVPTLVLPAAALVTLIVLGLRSAKVKLSSWGIGLGDWRWWLPHHGVLLALLVPVLVATTWLVPPLAAYYPTNHDARTSGAAFLTCHLGLAIDFVGWEFLFRGFLLFAFARRGDALLAVLIQAFPFFLLHSSKPEIEFVSSFVGGIFAGWFCLRARSFFPLYVIHLTMITTVGAASFVMRNYG